MEPIFPGMDPYLEAPVVWRTFHEAFLSSMRDALRAVLPERYQTVLCDREEVGIVPPAWLSEATEPSTLGAVEARWPLAPPTRPTTAHVVTGARYRHANGLPAACSSTACSCGGPG